MTSTPSAQRISRAAAAAARDVNALLRQEHIRAGFKVEKFGRHPDGYLHARVALNGEAFYVHRKFGSWLMPGHVGSRTVLREVLSPFRDVLQQHARPFDDSDRRALAAREEEKKHARRQPAREATDPRGDDPPAAADRLPEGADRSDDHGEVRED